jgi:hypothetical protein
VAGLAACRFASPAFCLRFALLAKKKFEFSDNFSEVFASERTQEHRRMYERIVNLLFPAFHIRKA